VNRKLRNIFHLCLKQCYVDETVAVLFSCDRPVREIVATAKRKAHQEEEIVGQEMHAEPIFQRVFYV